MTGSGRFFSGLALVLVLTTGLACARADSSLSLEARDSLEASPLPLTGEVGDPGSEVGSNLEPDSGLADEGALGAFPAFMPPVAVGTETQECQLGTDPYSTCI